ncbi:heavy metal translocating P-type ATPase [cyanobacterium endosymbiont of Epithemia turgida]|uniref:heavy metal translocating P-type ATPase n=1 Tax=cyanobacterium endosymbiont of Epithemia turgida TaxID=718217 RepID=UPI0004D19DBF|nr:heavy metal translocating P-type ATPase [cyanobacterium endosymbiont of Epithemia turgida]BAP16939.1 cation-transporting P-type ATPase [cyanobacterium endosymbiont of Epithemia turgida isolate EtSB Lake Yunoko]
MVQLSPKTEETPSQLKTETVVLDVHEMKCAGCVKAVERQLSQQSGVISACVNLITEVAVVEYELGEVQPQALADKLTRVGFPANLRNSSNQILSLTHSNAAKRKEQQKLQYQWKLTTAAILLGFSGLGHLQHLENFTIPVISNIWFHGGLATVALSIPGREIIIDGWRGLRHGMANMNTLVGLGTVSAYVASLIALLFPHLGWECFFDEPVMLLGFILLGRTLEGQARNRASDALEALIALQPSVARLIGDPFTEDTSSIEIPVEQVQMGEWIRVLPGEKIPVDGEVVTGETLINESLVTGESVLVPKQAKDRVIAGTLNQSGAITIKTTHVGNDTTLAQIITSVEDAQTRKAPIQKFADTVAGYFAYGVMVLALLTLVFWLVVGTKIYPQVLEMTSHSHSIGVKKAEVALFSSPLSSSPILLSVKLAIAVLVVACPCALGLATPTAILVGTGIGAERGLLIKGGDVLEKVHKLDTIVFDKTGTLTLGCPKVTDCIPLAPISPQRLLQLAATIESGTNHPLAIAILEEAQRQKLSFLKAEHFQTQAGLGVSAIVEGKSVFLGHKDWLKEQGITLNEERALIKEDKTLVYVVLEKEVQGVIVLEDTLRPDAKETITRLQEKGLEVILLTGDRQIVAESIAQQLGINQVFAQVRPTEKATIIHFLQQQKTKAQISFLLASHPRFKKVAMVGDGINDAPALAQADLGVSLQGATEVALDTADIVLMGTHLLSVVQAIDLSLATFNKIRQNLFWALGYNVLAIPIAAGILLPTLGVSVNPALAGSLMACSSITVVTNSLLLRRQFPTQSD